MSLNFLGSQALFGMLTGTQTQRTQVEYPTKQTGRIQRQLTETQIKNAKARETAFKLVEPGGLSLLVKPSGAKLWRYRFTLHNSESMLALGRYPDVSLKRARELHQEARKLVASGISPVHHRHQEKLSTFGPVASMWQEATNGRLRASTITQREREIKNDLLPKLRDRPIDSITRIELTRHLPVVEKRAPETARNLRTHLNGIFEHAIDIGLVSANPTPSRRVLQSRQSKHHLALPPDRTGNFLRALDNSRVNAETRIAMLLVLLTAARKDEVISSKWEEISVKTKSWTIPASRMKTKREHWIPLSSQAIELLTKLRELVPDECVHLFPNRVDPRRPMANRSLNAVLDRLGYAGESTPHGMRAAFSTHFNKMGANIEREMLQAWADYLDLRRVG